MVNKTNQSKLKIREYHAQGTIEYLLMMTVIIVVLMIVLKPGGKITKTVNQSVELATQGIECMAERTCYNPPCEVKYTNCATGPVLP